ncbi:Fur family transcriptional regulator [Actimicrobium antarcticum]|uniref:Ferric uptake regulation protein n=1 Tax=Actimicrobium antarcticum TaxID=1051899 RepID=A0ABP7TYM8_9BURK
MAKQSFFDQAEDCIRRIDARATVARIRVLAVLLAQQSAVTHHQIETTLDQDEKIDRVTLYRALDWLAANGLVHKVVSADRVWLFLFNNKDAEHHQHAHFKCTRCAEVICLNDLGAANNVPPLPNGYRSLEIEMTVKGLCAKCA